MSIESSMPMHVSSPKIFPNARAMQLHTQQVTFVLIQNVVSKTMRNELMIEGSK
jgi:hypothetical protein